ncbi:hypothetical protein [Streptomyces sp. CC77]|nr:hypothetical protein [Streptomyces sp. CC77]
MTTRNILRGRRPRGGGAHPSLLVLARTRDLVLQGGPASRTVAEHA